MSISTRCRQLATLSGTRAWLACFMAGGLLAWGFAPYYVWPVIFISLPVWGALVQGAHNWRVAALRSFFFGYGFFMAGTWWIANALLVEADKFAWLMPLSILGLSAVMALWFLPLGALVWRGKNLNPLSNILWVAFAWMLMDYARSFGMFGFPWNLVGYIGLASLPVAQVASVVGVYGLGFCVVLAGLCPLLWVRFRHLALALPLLLIGALYGYGAWRMPPETAFTTTKVRLVQANIPQAMKWTAEGKQIALSAHAELTSQAGFNPDVVIWPETAMPYAVGPYSPWPSQLASLMPPSAVLLTGAQRMAREGDQMQIWNSLIAVDGQGNMPSSYDKHQLVPFGEFVPFRSLVSLDKITDGAIDFSRGDGPHTLRVGQVPPFSPLICYEVVFPHMAVDAHDRPEWLVNITNDGWYGDTAGPYQHFAAAQMRAIEQGLPVARVANTGISAMIDPYGRVVKQKKLNHKGNIDVYLPKALPTPRFPLSSL